jgi:signal recognition particle receptor subunit beta
VLADTRRLEDCFPAVDFFESRGIEFLIAVNEFEDALRYQVDDVRSALDLKPDIPVIFCDARDQRSATGVLIDLIKHLLQTRIRP